jgi:hypothetical protein
MIVPELGYKPRYLDPQIAKAMDIIGVNLCQLKTLKAAKSLAFWLGRP